MEAMSGTTIHFAGISDFLTPDMESAIRSVLDQADPAWSVSILLDKDTGNWNIGAQPGDGQPFEGVLDNRQHSTAAIQRLLSEWYEQFQEWQLDSEIP
jgi:hypothetical protein